MEGAALNRLSSPHLNHGNLEADVLLEASPASKHATPYRFLVP